MNKPDDARLKEHFEKLRDEDRRTAPDFLNTISVSRLRTSAAPRWRYRIPFAAALLLGAAAWIAVSRTYPSTPPPSREALISWSSPTAFLLETPGKQFFREPPPLGVPSIYGLPATRKDRR